MKEVPQIHLPEISGGDQPDTGAAPLPGPRTDVQYPRNPFGPVYDEPCVDQQ